MQCETHSPSQKANVAKEAKVFNEFTTTQTGASSSEGPAKSRDYGSTSSSSAVASTSGSNQKALQANEDDGQKVMKRSAKKSKNLGSTSLSSMIVTNIQKPKAMKYKKPKERQFLETEMWLLFDVSSGCSSNFCEIATTCVSRSLITHASLYFPSMNKHCTITAIQNLKFTTQFPQQVLETAKNNGQIVISYTFQTSSQLEEFSDYMWSKKDLSYDLWFMWSSCLLGPLFTFVRQDCCYSESKITCSRPIYIHLKETGILPSVDNELTILPSELYLLVINEMQKPDTRFKFLVSPMGSE